MKHTLALLLFAGCPLLAGTFPDVGYAPPAGWTDPKFLLSQDYPQTAPAAEARPWVAIDFKTQPKEYLQAILDYSFEGNVAVNFVPQNNTVRKWFHAPWLHYGQNMREFVSGLTRERGSKAFELAATQTAPARNFAVGFYNDQGGFTIGQVWKNPTVPDSSHVAFPEGTVTFKLLFTTASEAAVPFLTGSPEWVADINRSQDVNVIKNTKVRLLQIDVAVKDARSNCGGWTFGTFHFDSAMPGTSPWQKLRPLALMWGNDPTLTQSMFDAGTAPVESWVNPDSPIVQYRKNPPAGINAPKVMGWAGRGNGFRYRGRIGNGGRIRLRRRRIRGRLFRHTFSPSQ